MLNTQDKTYSFVEKNYHNKDILNDERIYFVTRFFVMKMNVKLRVFLTK